MKKFFSLFIILSMTFILVACSNQQSEESSVDNSVITGDTSVVDWSSSQTTLLPNDERPSVPTITFNSDSSENEPSEESSSAEVESKVEETLVDLSLLFDDTSIDDLLLKLESVGFEKEDISTETQKIYNYVYKGVTIKYTPLTDSCLFNITSTSSDFDCVFYDNVLNKTTIDEVIENWGTVGTVTQNERLDYLYQDLENFVNFIFTDGVLSEIDVIKEK